MTMRRFVFCLAAVLCAAGTGPALAAPGSGHGGGPGGPHSQGGGDNRGGAVRGLDRVDGVAGERGDKGRDIAETRGNRGGAVRGLERADSAAGEHGDRGRDIAETRGNRSGQDITALQQALKNKGRDPGTIDGRMGQRTRGALADYQKAEGLKVTGWLDAATRAKLGM